jgi:hypothetical protein
MASAVGQSLCWLQFSPPRLQRNEHFSMDVAPFAKINWKHLLMPSSLMQMDSKLPSSGTKACGQELFKRSTELRLRTI